MAVLYVIIINVFSDLSQTNLLYKSINKDIVNYLLNIIFLGIFLCIQNQVRENTPLFVV